MARAFSSWWPLLSTGLAGFARKSDALAPKALALPCGNSASSASACSSPGPAAGAQTPGDSGGHVASGVSPGSRLFPEWGDSFRGARALQPGAPVSLRPPAGVTLIRSHLVPTRLSAAWREKLPALGSRRCDGPTGSISAENRGLVQPLGPGTGEQRVHPSAPGRPPDPRRSATASAALDGPCPVSWARSPPRRAGPGGGDEVPRMGAEPRPGAGRSWGSRSRGRKSGDRPEGAVLPTSKREAPQSHLGSPAPRAPTGLSVLRARPDKVKHGQSGARLQQILSWKQN